eukprot:IDg18411t1
MRALSLFKLLPNDDDDKQAAGRDCYVAEVKTVKRFALAVKLIALGDSFRSISHQLHVICEKSGIAAYGGTSDVTIPNYVRVVCAASLQKLGELLERVWACSLELHDKRLKRCFSADEVEHIDQEFSAFHRAYHMEPELRNCLHSMKDRLFRSEMHRPLLSLVLEC